MYKRNIAAVLVFIFCLGLFFQYNRMDGFVRLSRNLNSAGFSRLSVQTDMQDCAELPADRFLLVYEPTSVTSMFMRHNLEKMIQSQKRQVLSVPAGQKLPLSDEPFTGVILATGALERVADLSSVEEYVQQGGTALLMQRLTDPGSLPLDSLGIASLGSVTDAGGAHMRTDFLFGAENFMLSGDNYRTEANASVLLDDARLHMTSADGQIPLLWEHAAGDGKYVVYNGMGFDDKMNAGLMTAMLTRTKTDYIYPIAGGLKLFYIDDFPAPTPEGDFAKIYDELHLSTEAFYREEWWPMMLSNARNYDLKYTGLVIETYGKSVHPPFDPLPGRKAKDNLVIYGRELLKAGGELGIHGYNHMSLAPAGYNQINLGYTPWESQEEMTESMRELRRYIKAVYPFYEIHTYVPPSNILSPEGHAAVKEAFPELQIYSSLYNGVASEHAYYQDFSRNEDGTYEIPRVTSGYAPSDDMKWEGINVLNALGVFSHFVHPDELFYEESKDLTWHDMKKGMERMLDELQERYGWLEACTASEGKEYLEDYLKLSYRVVKQDNVLDLYTWNYRGPVSYILRTESVIDKVEGCSCQEIDADVYRIKISASHAKIILKGGSSE